MSTHLALFTDILILRWVRLLLVQFLIFVSFLFTVLVPALNANYFWIRWLIFLILWRTLHYFSHEGSPWSLWLYTDLTFYLVIWLLFTLLDFWFIAIFIRLVEIYFGCTAILGNFFRRKLFITEYLFHRTFRIWNISLFVLSLLFIKPFLDLILVHLKDLNKEILLYPSVNVLYYLWV